MNPGNIGSNSICNAIQHTSYNKCVTSPVECVKPVRLRAEIEKLKYWYYVNYNNRYTGPVRFSE